MKDTNRGWLANRPGTWMALLATAIVAWSTILVAVLMAPSPSREDRERDVLAMHELARRLSDSAYTADPGLRIEGRLMTPSPSVRVIAVESRLLASVLASAQRAPQESLPFPLPIAAETRTRRDGSFLLEGVQLGRYATFVSAPGYRPVRRDGIIVRDSIGARTRLTLRPESGCSGTLPQGVPDGASFVPLYAGHWPDLAWHDAKAGVVRLERRDPDGWPLALAWKHGERFGWCRVEVDEAGSATIRETQLADLVSSAPLGPAAIAESPLAALRAHTDYMPVDASDAPGGRQQPGPSRLRVRSREPFAHYEITLDSGAVFAVFADVSGTGEFYGPTGAALVRAVVHGGRRTRPTGAFLQPGAEVSIYLPFRDVLEQRVPDVAPRVELPGRNGLYGFLRNLQGEPVVGATIAVFGGDPDRSRPFYGATDEHGFYRIDSVPAARRYTMRYGRSAGFGDSLLQHVAELTGVVDQGPVHERVDLQLTGTRCEVAVPDGQLGDLILVHAEGREAPIARVYVKSAGESVVLRDLPVASYRLTLEREAVPVAESGLQPAGDGSGLSLSGEWRSR
ncbi:MAG: hypothetical protein ACE37K_17020 [Planctomycetota bacterium]